MEWYPGPQASSLAPPIAPIVAGLPFPVERVSLKTEVIAGGGNFRDIEGKGPRRRHPGGAASDARRGTGLTARGARLAPRRPSLR